MRRAVLRWAVATAATIAAFTTMTWVSGALVLTMHDPAVKWGIAGALGVAIATLAALWGHSYAIAEPHQPELQPDGEPPTHPTPGASDGGGETRNDIHGGTFRQPVIQGRDIGTVNTTRTRPASPPPQLDEVTTPGSPAVGGDTHNTVSDGLFHGPVIQARDIGTLNPGQR